MVDESTRWGENKQYIWYQGPWEPFVRNIDPTIVHHQSINFQKPAYSKDSIKFTDWNGKNEDWLVSVQNLPEPKSIISISYTDDEWYTLESHPSWEEPVPLGKDKYDYPRKHLWYQIRSYFVKNEEAEDLIHWLKEQHFMGNWLPGMNNRYQVFSREYYWSPAYHYFKNPYYGGIEWEGIYDRKTRSKLIANVLPTTEKHIWESGANYEDQPSYLAPREYMYSGMKLQYSKNIGEWLNEKKQVVCLDTSVTQGGSPTLIAKKKTLQDFLIENNLIIFWSCLGQKIIYGNSYSREHFTKWLEFSGVYALNGGKIEGELTPFIQNTIRPNGNE
jgi:hypothetical protein